MATQLQIIIDRIRQRVEDDHSIGATIATGVFAGAMMVIMTITYASLFFSGELSQFIAKGISMAIASVVIIGAVMTSFSSSAHIITQIDDDTAPVFALLLSLLVATLPSTLSSSELLLNVLVAIFVATLVSGVVLTLFGTFKFGRFVQFLPYSVMGGYFAAVGWLLLVGALTMLTDLKFDSFNSLTELFSNDTLLLWLPAILIGLWLRYMSSRMSIGPLLAGTIIVTITIFYLLHNLAGNSPSDLMAQGQLIGPFTEQKTSLLNPIFSLPLHNVEWSSILRNSASIASISLISLLSIILCISGLSLSTRQDLDTNHELKVSGLANIVTALFGGMSAAPSLSITKLAHEIHPRPNRIIGWTALAVGLVTFYFGMNLVAHIPKVVLGSLLIYIGLGFVNEWLIDGLKKFEALEYSVIPIILIVSIFAGFLPSIVAGIIAAIFLFVIKYSQIRVIRYQASGANLRSNLIRDVEQNQVLKEHGDQIHLFTLQGYLFFGTAGSLYQTVLNYVKDPDHSTLKYVILDFSQVIGVDSSATLNFEKLAQRLAERQIFLITTGLKKDVISILRRGGLNIDSNTFLIQHLDIDKGMEWCENYILKEQSVNTLTALGIFERIADALPQSDRLHKLASYLKKIEVTAGQILIATGEESNEIFFLETCAASAYIIDSRNKERRISGAGRGAIFGEIGFFLNIPRTALVRADSDGELFSLSKEDLTKMEREEPELAAAITRYLIQIVTERLVNTTQSLRYVL